MPKFSKTKTIILLLIIVLGVSLGASFVIFSNQTTEDNSISYLIQARQANTFFDYKNANKFYKKAIKNNTSSEILEEYLAFSISQQDFKSALISAEQIIINNPSHSLSKLIIAVHQLKEKNLENALRHLNNANFSEFGVNNIVYTALDGLTLYRSDQFATFVNKTSILQDIAPDLYLYMIASFKEINKEYEESAVDYFILVDIFPTVDNILAFHQISYVSSNNFDYATFNDYLGDPFLNSKKSLEYIKNYKSMNEATFISGLLTKIAEFSSNDIKQTILASDSFLLANIALMLNPLNSYAKIIVANFYQSIGNYDSALKIYTSIKGNDYYSRISFSNALDMLNGLEKHNEALEVSEEYLVLDKENPKPLLDIGHIYHNLGQYKKALKYFNKALITSQKNNYTLGEWLAYYYMGVSYDKLGDWSEAEKNLLLAQKINAEDAILINYLAYSWIERNKNIDQAMSLLAYALERDPNNPDILDSYSWGLFKVKKYKQAEFFAKKANSIKPYDAILSDHYADILWANGKKDKAIYFWTIAYNITGDEKFREKIGGIYPAYFNKQDTNTQNIIIEKDSPTAQTLSK